MHSSKLVASKNDVIDSFDSFLIFIESSLQSILTYYNNLNETVKA